VDSITEYQGNVCSYLYVPNLCPGVKREALIWWNHEGEYGFFYVLIFLERNSIAWWWLCKFCMYIIMSSFLRLVLYQLRLVGIKVGHCVVSSPIYVLMYWGGMHVLWSCVVSKLESCVVSDWSLVLYQDLDLCCIKSILVLYQVNDSHRWYPMRMGLQLGIWKLSCMIKSCGILCDYIACHGHWVLKVPLRLS